MTAPNRTYGHPQITSHGRSLLVTCTVCDQTHPQSSGRTVANTIKHFERAGWVFTKNTATCPKHNKERPMKTIKYEAAEMDPRPGKAFEKIMETPVKADPPREPTKAQFREIFAAIHENWNDATERYLAKHADKTVAASLKVPRDWVKRVREEHFGPNDGNDVDVQAMRKELDDMLKKAVANQSAALDLATKFEDQERAIKQALTKLEGL